MAWDRIKTITAETNGSPVEYDTYDTIRLPTHSTARVKSGLYSLSIYPSSATGIGTHQSFASDLSMRANYWFSPGNLFSGRVWLWSLGQPPTEEHGLVWDSEYGIITRAGGVDTGIIGTASEFGLNIANRWMSVGLYIDMDNTGSDLHIYYYLNGKPVANYNSTSIVNFSGLYVLDSTGGFSPAGAYLDDFYVEQDLAGPLLSPAPPPPFVFPYSAPNGAGADANWTPNGAATNWEAVDETGAHDGDTTHNSVTGANQRDTFQHSDVIPPAHRVFAAIPRIHADANAAADIRMVAYDGVTYKNGATRSLAGAGYEMLEDYFADQPDASAWNNADMNSMQFGYETLTA